MGVYTPIKSYKYVIQHMYAQVATYHPGKTGSTDPFQGRLLRGSSAQKWGIVVINDQTNWVLNQK